MGEEIPCPEGISVFSIPKEMSNEVSRHNTSRGQGMP